MEEIWKEYPFDTRYQVSNLGNVKGQKGNILAGTKTAKGYKKIGIYKNRKGTFKYIHRMVMETFCPKELEEMEKLFVNHKDGDVTNNALENLEWVTPQENNIHARDILKISYNTEAAHQARRQKIKVTNLETNEEIIYNSLGECAEAFGIPYQNIQYNIKENKIYKKIYKFEKI